MFKTKIMQNVSVILGKVGCGSSKEINALVTKGVPGWCLERSGILGFLQFEVAA
jgi:hypothetical protein